jgi:hypothetical protein
MKESDQPLPKFDDLEIINVNNLELLKLFVDISKLSPDDIDWKNVDDD